MDDEAHDAPDPDDSKVVYGAEEPYSWRPAEPKPFYWLAEVAKFLGVSKTNIHFKIRNRDIRARMHRRGSRFGWVVAHEEMVRYMEEGSWWLSRIPVVEDRVATAREPSRPGSILDSIPDPQDLRRREREHREQRLRSIPAGSREALKTWIRGGETTRIRRPSKPIR